MIVSVSETLDHLRQEDCGQVVVMDCRRCEKRWQTAIF